MEYILQKVDSWKICCGGPSTKFYKSVESKCAFKDASCWRHNKCPIFLNKGTIRIHCVDLHRLLSRRVDNQKKTKKRMRLTSSLRSDSKVKTIIKRGAAKSRRLHRTEKLLKHLREDLNESAKKISNLESSKVMNDIEKLSEKIPDNQVKSVNFYCNKF